MTCTLDLIQTIHHSCMLAQVSMDLTGTVPDENCLPLHLDPNSGERPVWLEHWLKQLLTVSVYADRGTEQPQLVPMYNCAERTQSTRQQ